MSTILVSFLCIGGAFVHVKVHNHQTSPKMHLERKLGKEYATERKIGFEINAGKYGTALTRWGPYIFIIYNIF